MERRLVLTMSEPRYCPDCGEDGLSFFVQYQSIGPVSYARCRNDHIWEATASDVVRNEDGTFTYLRDL